MKLTVKDIAKAANVSPATVSNALNNRKGVSEEIKQNVLKAARELGYIKETASDKNTIRLVIFKRHGYVVNDTPFFSSLIEGIEKECRLQGYELLISHISIMEKDFGEIIAGLNNDSTSGMLILATEMLREDLELFSNYRNPIVLLDSCLRDSNINSVLINNEDASFRATSYLIENGHAEIGYIGSSAFIKNFFYRRQGFLDALHEFKIAVKKEYLISVEPTMEGAYRDMAVFLQNNKSLPTAFFADNDTIAFGVMRALKEKGINIPRDVSIIGFDDMPFCEITSPRLTTVKVFKQEMGSTAVKRLMALMIENNGTSQKIQINTELIIRDSVLKQK
ncbi:MAG: LacI family transcriptional regulator [Eubacterium sp.]|jgi:LacI family transcriptional regulator|nr:LacI family transcriptional regulator [Eubacterium sp.]